VLRISEINTKREFYELENYWNNALNRSIENNIFLTWEKMAPSVNHLGQNSSLRILCATESNKLVGIAPLRITHIGLKGYFGYGIIEPLTNGDTDYSGLIITEEQDACLHQFLAHLFSQKDWDFMYLPDLPQTSPSLALIKNATDIPKFEIEKGVICPYVAIPSSKEKLLSSLNRKFEKKLRKSLTKLEREHGRVELKNYYELGSLEQAIQILINLHQKRWTSRGNCGRFLKEEACDITLQTAKYFAEKDWLRLYFLTVNDKPVAVELNLEYNGKMYCHLKGFDIDYYKYRVGSLLTLKVLERCIEKGISEYDFMQGDEAYKFDWTDKYRQNINIKWVNERLSSKILDASLKVLNKGKFDKIIVKYIIKLKSLKDMPRKLGFACFCARLQIYNIFSKTYFQSSKGGKPTIAYTSNKTKQKKLPKGLTPSNTLSRSTNEKCYSGDDF
jgi:hypothetical protein